MIEATLVAVEGAHAALEPGRYLELLKSLGFAPDVLWLQRA